MKESLKVAALCPATNKYHRKQAVYATMHRFRYSFTCQGTSTRRQRSDLFDLRVKLPPVITSWTTQT